jgi:hypothetical protein
MSPFFAKRIKERSIEASKAKFTWGIKNGKEFEKMFSNYHFIKEVSLVEGMKKIDPIYKFIGNIPVVRNISNKIIVLSKIER